MKINLFGKTLSQIYDIAQSCQAPKYTAKQICCWIYQKNCRDISKMSDISKKIRQVLDEKYEISILSPQKRLQANDTTSKYLFAVEKGFIESAVIPEEERATLCLSTQIGCKRGCLFCCTGKQGFQGNLNVAEILGQYEAILERNQISNIVYMGMGEPLDNLENVLQSLEIFTSDWGYRKSSQRITVSTIGILPELEKFLQLSKCPLAISLHSPINEQRHQLLPGTRHYQLNDLINLLKAHKSEERRLTFEYIVLEGYNNTLQHVKELCRLLNGLSCRINLIPFHFFDGSTFIAPTLESVNDFKKNLDAKGLTVTVRRSRGQEISAACGLLSTKEIIQKKI